MTDAAYLTGSILLAMPGMGDPNFERSVIAMCNHDARGAFGVGIGHVRAGVTLHALLEELEIDPGEAPDCVVHHGGPVETGRGFVLHTPDWHDDDTLDAGSLCSVSGSLAILRDIAAGKGPSQWLIALGYAGWSGGQLEGEMRRHGWYAATGRADILFNETVEDRWVATWRAEGVDPSLLVGITGNA